MSSTVTRTWSGAVASRTATVPSDGVWRSAFVSRLSRTRSTCSGAQRARDPSPRPPFSSATFARAPRPRSRGRTTRRAARARRAGARARARPRRCARARTGRRRDSAGASPDPGAARGTRSGSARPSSIASSIAAIEATGVRRSWLAAATSSRRASKRLSRFAAIALNERPSSASSRGPPSGARRRGRRRRARAEADREDARSGARSTLPSTSAAATAAEADAAATARIFTSSPMWNITQPESSTASERQHDREQREPAELQPHGRQQPQRERRGEADGERGRGDGERERDHGTNR